MIVGKMTGVTITFGFRFTAPPVLVLTPLAATVTPTASLVSFNKVAGYYTTATVTTEGCDEIEWLAIGSGIDL